jgi:hypothetical protein
MRCTNLESIRCSGKNTLSFNSTLWGLLGFFGSEPPNSNTLARNKCPVKMPRLIPAREFGGRILTMRDKFKSVGQRFNSYRRSHSRARKIRNIRIVRRHLKAIPHSHITSLRFWIVQGGSEFYFLLAFYCSTFVSGFSVLSVSENRSFPTNPYSRLIN